MRAGEAKQGIPRFQLRFIAENTPGSIARMLWKEGAAMTGVKRAATAILRVEGMGDTGRAERLKHAVGGLEGVLLVDFNYILGNATISYDPDKVTLVQVKKSLEPNYRASV
jgi:hypothetical protein